MTPYENVLPVETLRELVCLDADTGRLYWKYRDARFFTDGAQTAKHNCAIWNGRFAGKRAFNTKQGMGYLHGAIGNIKFLAHRVVFALVHGRWPDFTVDHINGKKTDNRPINLRDVRHQDNMKNMRHSKASTTGHVGVYWDRSRGKYEAHITIDGKKKSLGRFGDMQDAIDARGLASEKHKFHENHGMERL